MPGENHKALVVWFSRVGNTVFEPDVDVVSTATLNRGAEGELLGNAQMVAGWIAEETGADVFPIQTAYTYPSDYSQTVSVGEGQDIDFVDLALATHLEDVSGYDIVWLAAPIWHYTVCTPLRAFLEETDFSGKTLYVMTTHCGSRFADTVEKIQQMQLDDPSVPTRLQPENGTKILMHFGDTVIPAVLNDSETARALIAKLPYTQHMSRYAHDFAA